MTTTNNVDWLRKVAQAIEVDAAQAPITAVVRVGLSFVINLGYDQGEKITPERLLLALQQHVARQIEDMGTDEAIDEASVIETFPEA